MPTSEYAQLMAAVVSEAAPTMKAAGFRKQRHTFNRKTEEGLTHVLNFQMGPYEPDPPNLDAEAQRRNREVRASILGPSLYGSFTVNLGVHIPEGVSPITTGVEAFVRESQCQVRGRLGRAGEHRDVWWKLDRPAPELGVLVNEDIRAHAFAWFERYGDRGSVFRAGESGDPRINTYMLVRMYRARGDHAIAAECLRTLYVGKLPVTWAHEWRRLADVREMAEGMGYSTEAWPELPPKPPPKPGNL